MSQSNLIASLTDVTTRLGEVVVTENDILRSKRPSALVAYQDEKQRLTGAYEHHMSALRSNPALLKQATAAEIAALKDATRRFRAALSEHRRMVQAAKSVTERMIQRISEEVAQRQRPVRRYDARAELASALSTAGRPVSLALNQVI